MMSLTLNTLRPHTTFFRHSTNAAVAKPSTLRLRPISATFTPSNPAPQQLYQPFRPPPSPLPPQFQSLDTNGRLEVLTNRLGLWFDYAPLIPTLIQEGFTPSSLEEATGISGVEQSRFVVAAQVRDSLIQSKTDQDVVAAFDLGGAELLYEIRLLSAQQRAAAARFIVANGFDAKGAKELARAMKDFPRRKGDRGWNSFDYAEPGDCLAFTYFRQGREHRNPSEQRTAALQQALSFAATEKAKSRVMEELKVGDGDGQGTVEEGIMEEVKVPVVRLKMGEVAEASSVAVLPVVKAGEEQVAEAPWECRKEGEFGVVAAEKGWSRWGVRPFWEPLAGLGRGGVAVAFGDARALPWRANRWYKEEAILVVADRNRKEVELDNGFYLVVAAASENGIGNGSGLKVERGSALKEAGVAESLGAVVLVVRPPREETDDQLSDEDWE